MKPVLFSFLFILLTFTTSAQALGEQKKTFTRADTLRGSLRPERTCFDVNYYELNIKVDTGEHSISGSNKIVFKAMNNFRVMQIDLFENMNIIQIISEGKELKYKREFNAVFVYFENEVPSGSTREITVYYQGKPIVAKRPPWDGGFTWTYDNNGKVWVGVSCEGMGASSWWPMKDHLSDEPDSMRIICTVPSGLQCISNGVEENVNMRGDNTTTFHWKVSYPINSYNVTLNIGDYVHFADQYVAADGEKLDLDYYVLSYNLEKAQQQFKQVKPMMSCYEKYLGKYPFWNDGYALVETPYLGMEHQGAIAYGNKYLTGYAGRDFSRIGLDFDYIIIHESGHEWWGNSVSCKDIADMWIHEGFCTYSEAIYVECLFGKDTAMRYINAKKTSVGNKNPVVGIYGVNEEGDGDMYAKGMLMLNTIRHIINKDGLWWSIVKGISDTAFKYKTTDYQEITNYISKKSGINLAPVFEQYLKQANIPVLEYKLKKTKHGEYELSYRWQVDVKNFRMPFVISYSAGQEKRINGSDEWQTTSIKLKKDTQLKVNDELMYIDVKKL
ncbi:MAG: M1 family metallopeptidase [Bacteroidetes bacterium]|nr:M1 family metallopeptidase [Bacteroidota bacterium]